MTEEKVNSRDVTILDLPSLPLSNIFSYLRPPDIRNCALTCQAFYALSKDPMLWRALYPTQWAYGYWTNSILDADELGSYRRTDCPVATKGQIQIECGLEIKRQWDLFETNLLTRMLEHLVPRVGPAVRELHLNCSNVLNDHLLSIALIHCPNLVTLDVKETHITEQAFTGLSDYDACRRLQNLDLSHCAAIQDSTMCRLASCWTGRDNSTHASSLVGNTLTVIEVDASEYNTPLDTGQRILSNDTRVILTTERLRSETTPRAIQLPNVTLGKRGEVSGVRRLNLSGCKLLTDETLYMLMTARTVVGNLTFLDLSGCYRLSGRAIGDFVKACPKLEPEGLYYCDHILLGPYQFEANGCSNIQKSGCCVVPEF